MFLELPLSVGVGQNPKPEKHLSILTFGGFWVTLNPKPMACRDTLGHCSFQRLGGGVLGLPGFRVQGFGVWGLGV